MQHLPVCIIKPNDKLNYLQIRIYVFSYIPPTLAAHTFILIDTEICTALEIYNMFVERVFMFQ